jgi:hypothetical protein
MGQSWGHTVKRRQSQNGCDQQNQYKPGILSSHGEGIILKGTFISNLSCKG